MTRSCLFSIALVCLLICQPLDAWPGKGGGFKPGGGSKIFRGGGGKGLSSPLKSVGGGNKILSPAGKGNIIPRGNGQTLQKLTGVNQAVNVQRANESRKLLQRQQTAQQLRDISARNGNQNLMNTANRMDQQALQHYQSRQAKIDQLAQQNPNNPLNPNQLNDPLDQQLTDQQIANLKDPSLQQQHRLLNEERKLQHQLSVAQQLRDISAQNGNANLIRTAEQMESMAANRYASQMTKILGPSASLPGINPAATPLISPTPPAPVPEP